MGVINSIVKGLPQTVDVDSLRTLSPPQLGHLILQLEKKNLGFSTSDYRGAKRCLKRLEQGAKRLGKSIAEEDPLAVNWSKEAYQLLKGKNLEVTLPRLFRIQVGVDYLMSGLGYWQFPFPENQLPGSFTDFLLERPGKYPDSGFCLWSTLLLGSLSHYLGLDYEILILSGHILLYEPETGLAVDTSPEFQSVSVPSFWKETGLLGERESSLPFSFLLSAALNNMGTRLESTGEKFYQAALKIHPHCPMFLNNLAECQQQLDQKIIFFEEALLSNPNDFGILKRLAEIYSQRELPDQAILYYQRAQSSFEKVRAARSRHGDNVTQFAPTLEEIIDISKALAHLYERKSESEKAEKYNRRVQRLTALQNRIALQSLKQSPSF